MHLRKTDKTTYQSTLMLWEGNRQIQEYTDDFVFTTVYDQDSFEPVARVVQGRNPSNKQPHSSDDGRLNNADNADNAELFKVYHYHNNHLGTPQELTDECGNVVWCNYEWAWGGRYTHHYTSQSLNGCAILETDLQPIRFQGQFYDVETGLHYNRFRYYDSDVGMFIQRDPIGLLGGVNVFAYAPNPVGWVDPWGLSCISPYQTRYHPKYPGRPHPRYSVDTSKFTEGELTSNGGIRNRQEFWEKWATKNPHTLSKSNLYAINVLRVSPKIDKKWIQAFPEHANHKGEKLIHHHVDFGRYAIPVPASTHVGSGGIWHTK